MADKKISLSVKKILKGIGVFLIYAVLALLFWYGWKNNIIQEEVRSAGVFGPIIYIIFASLKSIFPIIPGEVLVTLGVIIFGPVLGFFYSLLGLTLGSLSAFLLARRYGQPFVKWLMGEDRFNKVNKLSGDKTLFTFFLIYLAPGTPDDFVTYIAGLTSVPLHWFLMICILGRVPSYVIYVLAGQSLRTLNFKLLFFWWAVLFFAAGILYLTKKHIFDKLIHRQKK